MIQDTLFGEPATPLKAKPVAPAPTVQGKFEPNLPVAAASGKVISIRGTSGSGKTHLAKSIMALYDSKEAVFRPGRAKPIYYLLRKAGHNDLAVVGSYETDCGGCDTVSDIEEVYRVVNANRLAGRDVMFEGLLMACEIWRSIKIETLHCVYLATPIDQCLASVNARRAGKGKLEPVNPKNTQTKFKSVMRSIERMAENAPQIPVFKLERAAAFEKVKEILGL